MIKQIIEEIEEKHENYEIRLLNQFLARSKLNVQDMRNTIHL